MDWTNKQRIDRFGYELIDPWDISVSRGWLDGVTSCRITHGYYTDTRVSAKIEFFGDSYIENSLIRVHHYVDAESYHHELGTFFVDDISGTREHAQDTRTLTLVSLISRMSEDKLVTHYSIPAGKLASDVIAELCAQHGADYRWRNAKDHRYQGSKLYDYGECPLTVIFDVLEACKDRLEVDGHGRLIVSRYVNPATKTPVATFSESNGSIIGAVQVSDDMYSTANRVAVVSKSGDDEIVGHADMPSSSKMSYHRRGRFVTTLDNVTDLQPATALGAQQHAADSIAELNDLSREFQFDTFYSPLTPGDTATLILDGESIHVMLKTREIDVGTGLICSDTWKEV